MAYVEKTKIGGTAGNELGINANSEAKVNIADGSDVALGSTTDAAVDTNTTGTISGKLRGVVKLLVNIFAGLSDKSQSTKITNGSIEADLQTLGTQVTSSSKGLVTHSVVHGTPDGGLTYYDLQIKNDGSLPVSIISSALPSGAATEATLVSIKSTDGIKKITDALPVGANVIGKVSIDQATPGTTDRVTANVDKIGGSALAIGQQLAAASIPVILPAATITTLTPPAAITGFATATKQDDQSTLIGAITETAPGTDTASSGLNGRLQRIAQRLTSLIGLLPSALVGGRLDVNVGARVATTATKTVGTSVLSLQSNAASTVLISSAVDVSTKLAANLFIHFGRRSATAAGAGVNIRVEASSKSSGNGHWYPLAIFTTAFAACEAEAVSGTVNSGTNVITVASTSNLTAGDLIYIDNGTIANSEWGRIKSIVSNTSVTIEDNLVNAQTGATMYDSAEMYACQLDLSAVSRLRVVVDGSLFTQACAIEVDMVTLDSLV